MSFITQPKRTFFRALGFVTVATLTSLAWQINAALTGYFWFF